MADNEQTLHEAMVKQYLSANVSRAQVFKAGALAALAVAVPGVAHAAGTAGSIPGSTFSEPFYPATNGSYTPESLTSIFTTAVTAETLAVTVLTAAATSTTLNLANNPLLLATVQAALAEEFAHLTFLRDGSARSR